MDRLELLSLPSRAPALQSELLAVHEVEVLVVLPSMGCCIHTRLVGNNTARHLGAIDLMSKPSKKGMLYLF
jgi:hypothetical protein